MQFNIGEYLLRDKEMETKRANDQMERQFDQARYIGRLEYENELLKKQSVAELPLARGHLADTTMLAPPRGATVYVTRVAKEVSARAPSKLSRGGVQEPAKNEEIGLLCLLEKRELKKFQEETGHGINCQFIFSRHLKRGGMCTQSGTSVFSLPDPYYNRCKKYVLCPRHSSLPTIADMKKGKLVFPGKDAFFGDAAEVAEVTNMFLIWLFSFAFNWNARCHFQSCVGVPFLSHRYCYLIN